MVCLGSEERSAFTGTNNSDGVYRPLSGRRADSDTIPETVVAKVKLSLAPSHLSLLTPVPQAPGLDPMDGSATPAPPPPRRLPMGPPEGERMGKRQSKGMSLMVKFQELGRW